MGSAVSGDTSYWEGPPNDTSWRKEPGATGLTICCPSSDVKKFDEFADKLGPERPTLWDQSLPMVQVFFAYLPSR